MHHVMIDIETMGNTPDSAIIALGAVFFDRREQKLGEEFYRVIDLESSVAAGLRMTPSTVMWWLKQSDQARAQFNSMDAVTLQRALAEFADWFTGNNGTFLWGNGSDFDNIILSNAYKAIQSKQPWAYYNNRCYRTIKNMFRDVKMQRTGTYHNALDDAKSQANHYMAICAAHNL